MRRRLNAGAVGVMLGFYAGFAAAATLTTSGACDEADAIRRQVETLVQRPLDSVDGWEFELHVERAAEHAFELRLLSREGAAVTRERVIRGSSCGELAEAAAVAIAMMIRDEHESGTDRAEPAEQPEPLEKEPAPAPLNPPARVKSAARAENEDAAPIVGFVGLGALVDAGTLPGASAGPAFHAGLERSRLRFSIGGLVLPSSTVEHGTGGRASFSLLAGDVRGCLRVLRTRVGSSLCLAHELGRLAGEGEGVTNPRLGATLFQATGLELSLEFELEETLRLRLRTGAAFPLERRAFELDGERIHRPAAAVWRARAEVELFQ